MRRARLPPLEVRDALRLLQRAKGFADDGRPFQWHDCLFQALTDHGFGYLSSAFLVFPAANRVELRLILARVPSGEREELVDVHARGSTARSRVWRRV
eukprot:2492601-Prymnesium_polylepis.1